MKSRLVLFIFLIFSTVSFAQTSERSLNTIDVQGYSKLLANPDNYIAQFLIQEEEQKAGYATIGKISIDSIKINLFANLKKFGIDEKELKVLGISSREISQYPNFLTNISYEVKLKNKEIASKIVNEMRFAGLKGVVIKRVYSKAQKDALADTLYNEALNDAKRIATELAKKSNKRIGEVKSIELRSNSVTSFGADPDINADLYNTYNLNRFEMDFRDKYATCFIRVIFDMQ